MDKKIILIYTILLFLFLFLNRNCKGNEIINLNNKIEKYIYNINNNLEDKQYKKITNEIIKQSKYYNIPYLITLAIIEVESNFNQFAIGQAREIGLMQIYTLECSGIKANKSKLFDIDYNIAFGLCILKNKLKISNNNYIEAILAYNGSGPKARKYTLKILKTINKIRNIFYK